MLGDGALFPACVEVQKSPARNESAPSDGSTMVIKVAGQTYHVPSAKKQHNKSHSLGSLSDFNLDIDKPKKYSSTGDNNAVEDAVITNNDVCKRNSEQGDVVIESCGGILSENGDASHEEAPSSFALAKSKSEGNPFSHKRKGKIIKITERPRGNDSDKTTKWHVNFCCVEFSLDLCFFLQFLFIYVLCFCCSCCCGCCCSCCCCCYVIVELLT